MDSKRLQAGISRADLLWSLWAVADDQHVLIASMLGYEEITQSSGKGHNEKKSENQQKPAENNNDTQEEPPHKNLMSEFKPPTSSYYRVKERQRQSPSDSSKKASKFPEWFENAKPNILEESATRIPDIHRIQTVFPPLTSWARVWPFLQRVLGADCVGLKPDVSKLLKGLAQGKCIRRMPKKIRYTWAPSARILIDINEGNFPYRKDFIHLCQQLVGLRGIEGLEVQYIYDEPGGYICRYQDQKELIEAWSEPNKELPLLILSDLGMQTQSKRVLFDWLEFGQKLALQKIRPTVLMPVAKSNIDRRLLKYFDCVVWDIGSRLKPIMGNDLPEEDKGQNDTEAINSLLAYHFPALRVELGLSRSIRLMLSANQYDVGHEAAVWKHPAVTREGDEWGWQAKNKLDYLSRFKTQVNTLSETSKRNLVNLIGCYHAQLPDELYFEVMLELIELGLPVPEEVRSATHQFLADSVKTYFEHHEHEGLHLWVKRYLARHDDERLRLDKEYCGALMAIAYERERILTGAHQIEYPSDISPDKILPFVTDPPDDEQMYLLRQRGMELELVREQDVQNQSDDWGLPGITLIKLALADTKVFHIEMAADGSKKHVCLNMEASKNPHFSFTPGMEHHFQMGPELITTEVFSAHIKPHWITFRGIEKDADCAYAYVKTQSNDGGVHTWYWHPPEWNAYEGMLRGFWHYNKPGQLETPKWATDSGRDAYGFYADVEIIGITQCFRWIEPGSFMMGSLESEKGRKNDEEQHKVTLTRGYWLADTTCTLALWEAVWRGNILNLKDETFPVTMVSWEDIQQFLGRINVKFPKLNLCLPTEAQWEYACRAGTETPFNFSEELSLDRVNYCGTWGDVNVFSRGALQKTSEVKRYPCNNWGLHEMHGNVREWCQDWYNETYPTEFVDPAGAKSGLSRVLRGGSWASRGRSTRSAARSKSVSNARNSLMGFRFARGHDRQSRK